MEENKTVLVTGGSRGIGKEIALKFAKQGYDVIINYVSDKTDTEELKKELEANGGKALIVKADVTNPEQIENLVKKAIETFEKIDVLVNNAGITKDNLLMRMSEEEFDKVIEVNLKGTYLMTKAVTKYMMKKRQGSIINLSSVVGVTGNAGQCNYAASKAGIIGFTKSVAKELASRNIRANAIAPGFFVTAQNEKLLFNEDGTPTARSQKILNSTPMGRYGEAHELIGTLLYLVNNDASGFVNGVCIPVDGAFSAYSGV